MTILFFGNYIPDYPRIVVLKKGLQAHGVKILECHTRKTGLAKFFDLYRQHRLVKDNYDALLVTMGAYSLVPFARLLTKKKLIFDAFVSLKLTHEDRGKSGGAFWDIVGCRHADLVLLDTNAQIDYFVSQYKLPREKFVRIPVSTDLDVFNPHYRLEIRDYRFIVHWHGHIVPFHGLQVVIEAAKLLKDRKDIEFRITTRFNKAYEEIKKQASENVKFFPETSYAGLAEAINGSDICLGIFGANKKAEMVIPNKIFEAVACKKTVITRDSPAVREWFDETSMKLIRPNNPEELAAAILELKNDQNKMILLADKAHEIFLSSLMPGLVVKPLLE